LGALIVQVNILEAKNRLSELVKSAQAGEEVIIANRGQPVVRLSPIEAYDKQAPPVNSGAALSTWLQARPLQVPMRDDDEIEASIKENRDAWG
jgi:prevent-host-death family protein